MERCLLSKAGDAQLVMTRLLMILCCMLHQSFHMFLRWQASHGEFCEFQQFSLQFSKKLNKEIGVSMEIMYLGVRMMLQTLMILMQ